ncbi:hypothetical protein V8E36_006183 [Tilletia maclaganii]
MSTTLRQRQYAVYDVFTAVALKGNPVAVVMDSDGLLHDEAQKLSFAQFTNLSETVFINPPSHPDADYKLDIFTPAYRLPFAGHPTLGAANAWLDAGGKPKRAGFLTQECDIGLVQIKIESPASDAQAEPRPRQRLSFAAPPFINEGDIEPDVLRGILTAFKLDPETDVVGSRLIDNGPGWHGIHVRDADLVLNRIPKLADLDLAVLPKVNIGVVGPYKHDKEAQPGEQRPQYELRAIVNRSQSFEDPVTGSLNAGVAKWLISSGHAPAEGYIASQGFHRERQGKVYVQADEQAQASKGNSGTIWVGGDAVKVIEGTVWL